MAGAFGSYKNKLSKENIAKIKRTLTKEVAPYCGLAISTQEYKPQTIIPNAMSEDYVSREYFHCRGYIKSGNLTHDPLELLWPENRFIPITSHDLDQERIKRAKWLATLTQRENSALAYDDATQLEVIAKERAAHVITSCRYDWAIVDADVYTADTIQKMLNDKFTSKEYLTARKSNEFKVFAFRRVLKGSTKYSEFVRYYRCVLKEGEWIVESSSDHYTYSYGSLGIVLIYGDEVCRAFHTSSKLLLPAHPYLFLFEKQKSCEFEWSCPEIGNSLLKEIDFVSYDLLAVSLSNLSKRYKYNCVRLNIDGPFDSIENMCRQLKAMAQYFCIDIYAVLPERYWISVTDAPDSILAMDGVDNIIYHRGSVSK